MLKRPGDGAVPSHQWCCAELAHPPPGPPPTTIASNEAPDSGTFPVSIGSVHDGMVRGLHDAL